MSLEPAKFSKVGDTEAQAVSVMFNPASLKISVANKMPDEDAGGSAKGKSTQAPKPSVTKMETELVFDTTEDGSDVRQLSRRITQHAISVKAKGSDPVEGPSHVQLVWGTFFFRGMIESLTETLDFWSAEGIPLRSTVQLTLASLDGHGSYFSSRAKVKTAVLGTAPPNGALMTMVATIIGDANAGRAIAAANGAESMRFGDGGPVAVARGVELKKAAGFSAGASAEAGRGGGFSAGASAGIGAGASAGVGFGAGAVGGAAAGFSAGAGASFGAGASAGFEAGASAGFGASASAGFGANASAGFGTGASAGFGAGASAGIAASSGAFAGLGQSRGITLSAQVDPSRLLTTSTLTMVTSGSSFDIAGRVTSWSASGLSADVGGESYRTETVRVW